MNHVSMEDHVEKPEEMSSEICNPGQNISDKLQFFCEIAPYGKSSISIFQDLFASIDKILILVARLSTRL